MTSKFRFQAVSHSWVALHPQPQGVIYFIGGAFFGTFGPMLFYRHLLRYFFDQGYTLILLPFNFTFNHYREAFFLIGEQYQLLPELVRMAQGKDYEYEVYLNAKKSYWLGHSIGCKYIALLEGFSALPENDKKRCQFIQKLLTCTESYDSKTIQAIVAEIKAFREDLLSQSRITRKTIAVYTGKTYGKEADSIFKDLYIKDQPSILLAPVNSGTDSAIKPKIFADLIDSLGLGVKPSPAITRKLIQQNNLFNLLILTRFQSDKIAAETCNWFIDTFGKPPVADRYCSGGGHLRPLGIPIASQVFTFCLDRPWLASITTRNKELEDSVNQHLKILLQRIES